MKVENFVGIDIGKDMVDVHIHGRPSVQRFKNCPKGFVRMLSWLRKNGFPLDRSGLLVFENTGMYSRLLSLFLSERDIPFCMASGLEIKRSMGIVRGKSDKVDAQRISLYAHRMKDELSPSRPIDGGLEKIKAIYSLRSKLVRQRAGHITTLNEQKKIYPSGFSILFKAQKHLIRELNKEIEELDSAIQELIRDNPGIKKNYDLVTGIKGIGKSTAIATIVYTANFTKFETWRKFASYCGVAPFQYQSGTSVKKRTRVSNLANKKIKTMFHLCAITAIQHSTEMRLYYQNRIAQGKNRMSTINIIRNKLIAPMFAVVKRGTPYVDNLKYIA